MSLKISSGMDPTLYIKLSIDPPFIFSKTIDTHPSGVFQWVPIIPTKKGFYSPFIAVSHS